MGIRKMYGRDYYDDKFPYDDRHHGPTHHSYVPVPTGDPGPESHTMMHILGATVALLLFIFVVILVCGAGKTGSKTVAYKPPVQAVAIPSGSRKPDKIQEFEDVQAVFGTEMAL